MRSVRSTLGGVAAATGLWLAALSIGAVASAQPGECITEDQAAAAGPPQSALLAFRAPRMPRLFRMSQDTALSRLAEYHLAPKIEAMDSDSPPGVVAGQWPAPGAPILPKRPIVLCISNGRQAMPGVKGWTLANAVNEIVARRHLSRPSVTQAHSDADKGIVTDQDPPPNDPVTVKTAIKLEVSDGLTQVPPLTGASMPDALTKLADARLLLGARVESLSSQGPGIILSTDPKSGDWVDRGSAVAFVVTSGQNLVPSVIHFPRANAEASLRAAGFQPLITGERFDPADPGTVATQDPLGGQAPIGSSVRLELATDKVVVPLLGGLDLAAAQGRLTSSHLVAGPVSRGFADRPFGAVASQSPQSGEVVRAGTPVSLRLSLGPWWHGPTALLGLAALVAAAVRIWPKPTPDPASEPEAEPRPSPPIVPQIKAHLEDGPPPRAEGASGHIAPDVALEVKLGAAETTFDGPFEILKIEIAPEDGGERE